jgi:hypothetical protein
MLMSGLFMMLLSFFAMVGCLLFHGHLLKRFAAV